VVGCDVDADTAAETVALAKAEGLDIACMAPVDLADPVAARRWVEDGARVHGRIDVVYNNAARTALGPFPEISLDDYRYAVANEIDLVWHVCQASWSHLAASKGVIISTASIAGLIGTRDLKQAAHALLKGGIIALTRQLAAEGAQHGIRIWREFRDRCYPGCRMTRLRSRAKPARPYICRLIILIRVTLPSTAPEL
jgi:meso-butanediol dehydrogenase / (S,S)-butanediol dehydrogenase / diacetyl reductase